MYLRVGVYHRLYLLGYVMLSNLITIIGNIQPCVSYIFAYCATAGGPKTMYGLIRQD